MNKDTEVNFDRVNPQDSSQLIEPKLLSLFPDDKDKLMESYKRLTGTLPTPEEIQFAIDRSGGDEVGAWMYFVVRAEMTSGEI